MSDTVSIIKFYCPECGYDLRAIESPRCPECGLEIDRTRLGESIVPWLHREKIGRYRAFWRTVNLATFRVRKLSTDMNRPARFADALKFRRLAVLHAWIPLVAIQWFCALIVLSEKHPQGDSLGSVLQIILLAFWSVCLWFYLLLLGGVGGYFFHPKSLSVVRQNRSVALSCYACAPLAYIPLALATLGSSLLG